MSYPIRLPVGVPMAVGSRYHYSSLTLPVGETSTDFLDGLSLLVPTTGGVAMVLSSPQCW